MKVLRRIFHHWESWECFRNGFYGKENHEHFTRDECLEKYAEFLSDIEKFKKAMKRVTTEWINSSEHFLSNDSINRVAWLGQASACIELGLSSLNRGGFYKMPIEKQELANKVAKEFLHHWLRENGQNKTLFD